MSKNNLDGLSRTELLSLQKRIEAAIKSYDTRKKKDALSAAQAAALEHGFALGDLVGSAKPIKAKSPAKYRHPENPAATWSGRGRRPDWVKEHLEAGKSLEELAI